jgi:hypothetical protein
VADLVKSSCVLFRNFLNVFGTFSQENAVGFKYSDEEAGGEIEGVVEAILEFLSNFLCAQVHARNRI